MGEHWSTIRPVLRLESALLRFFEQFGSVLRSQFNYFLDERCFLRCIDLGRRSGTRRNRSSQLLRSVRWNVDCFSSAHTTLLPSESSLQFTVEQNTDLLEIC